MPLTDTGRDTGQADEGQSSSAVTQPITVRSHWQSKRLAIEVTVTRVTLRTVSYIALDKSFSGTLLQWLFLRDFEPVTERKRKGR